MIKPKDIMIFIDPSYESYYKDELFNPNSVYNRDNCLLPFIYLKNIANSKGIEIYTADCLVEGRKSGKINVYFSFGILNNYKKLSVRKDTILSSFFIFEPPVVAPKLYESIKELSKYFNRIFTHSSGKSLESYIKEGINISKLYWPQTESNIIKELWENRDRKFLALINANKKPRQKKGELYSERIKTIAYFSKTGEIDLYGPGWNKTISFLPYLLNRRAILKTYRGPVKSKYETLSRYNFAICYENMIFPGYVTEKVFDCFFVGTIPIYLGAPDIEKYVPKECFIDRRDFNDYNELRNYLKSLPEKEIAFHREAAKSYLNSEKYKPFTKEYFAETILKDAIEDAENSKDTN